MPRTVNGTGQACARSAATTELLADAARLRAWRDHALAAYRRPCFDPVALLRRADAWNERARGDRPFVSSGVGVPKVNDNMRLRASFG